MSNPLSDLNVLVVDDHSAMRRILRRLLEAIDIRNVTEAANGAEAITILEGTSQDEDHDLVICDLFMDKMDGLEFCNAVRRSDPLRKRRIPIILLTAERDKLLLDVVRQVGATTVIHKPISAPDLKKVIERSVGFSSAQPVA
jgi:CheY-like chemotaxis protein